jgi:hypothetical protein
MEESMARGESRYRAVHNLYGTYHKVCVNRKYYNYRLEAVKQWNTVIEILIAVGVSSSVGSLALWKMGILQTLWSILGGVVAILAIVKPFLQLPKQIERYSRLFVGNNDAWFEFKKLIDDIQEHRNLSPEVEAKFVAALERLRQVEADEDLRQDKRLLARFENEVNAEIPIKKFWSPKKTGE